eukprot:5852212-Pyramimonas_sp.AAC.1
MQDRLGRQTGGCNCWRASEAVCEPFVFGVGISLPLVAEKVLDVPLSRGIVNNFAFSFWLVEWDMRPALAAVLAEGESSNESGAHGARS